MKYLSNIKNILFLSIYYTYRKIFHFLSKKTHAEKVIDYMIVEKLNKYIPNVNIKYIILGILVLSTIFILYIFSYYETFKILYNYADNSNGLDVELAGVLIELALIFLFINKIIDSKKEKKYEELKNYIQYKLLKCNIDFFNKLTSIPLILENKCYISFGKYTVTYYIDLPTYDYKNSTLVKINVPQKIDYTADYNNFIQLFKEILLFNQKFISEDLYLKSLEHLEYLYDHKNSIEKQYDSYKDFYNENEGLIFFLSYYIKYFKDLGSIETLEEYNSRKKAENLKDRERVEDLIKGIND